MNAVNGVSVKIFLRNDGEAEARRFVLPPGIATDLSLFKEQLKSYFPILNEVDYKLTWKGNYNWFAQNCAIMARNLKVLV